MLSTILIFIVVLAVLIIVHETGHFLAARAFGIRVDEFGLGFGPKLWSKKMDEITNPTAIVIAKVAIQASPGVHVVK